MLGWDIIKINKPNAYRVFKTWIILKFNSRWNDIDQDTLFHFFDSTGIYLEIYRSGEGFRHRYANHSPRFPLNESSIGRRVAERKAFSDAFLLLDLILKGEESDINNSKKIIENRWQV